MLFPLKCECIVDFLLPPLVTGWYIKSVTFEGRYQAISLRVAEVAQLEVGLSSAEVGLSSDVWFGSLQAEEIMVVGYNQEIYLKMGYPPVI